MKIPLLSKLLTKLGAYQAADKSRVNRVQKGGRVQPNSWLISDAPALRRRMHDVFRNTAIGRSTVRSLVSQVIPTVIQPRPNLVTDTGRETSATRAWNELAADAWKRWSEIPGNFSLDGMSNFSEMQRAIMHAVFIDGEVFVVRHRRKQGRRGIPSIRLEMISPERLESANLYRRRQPWDENNRPGVVYDDDGRAVAYRFYRRENSSDVVEFPAEDVAHIFVQMYSGQQIGESIAAAIGELIFWAGNYFVNECIGQEMGSRLPIILSSDAPESPFALANDDEQTSPEPTLSEIDWMKMLHLGQGETVSAFPQNRPGSGFQPFMQKVGQWISAAAGARYESVTGDYQGSNFTRGRLAKIDSEESSEPYREMLRQKGVGRIYEWFVEGCLLEGVLPLIATANADDHTDHLFRNPGGRYLDPAKEVSADLDSIRGGVDTLTNVLGRRGMSVEDVLEQQRREREQFRSYGREEDYDLIHGIVPESAVAAPMPEQEAPEEIDELEEAEQ